MRFLAKVVTFEVGNVFHPHKSNKLPDELQRLSLLMSGSRDSQSWLEKSEDNYDFFDLKGVLEQFFQTLHLDEIEWRKSSDLPCHPGRCAQILVKGNVLGFVGELHPKIRNSFELPEQPVCIAELDLDLIIKLSTNNHQMDFISNSTPIFEDLAFVLESSIPVEHVTPLILQSGKPLLRSAMLFDVYEGEQVEKGKRSLAYSLTFQATDRTLNDKEVEKMRKKIMRRLEHEFQATLRTC